jgi:biotin carboxyl carrier protein
VQSKTHLPIQGTLRFHHFDSPCFSLNEQLPLKFAYASFPATIPGTVIKILVQKCEKVFKGDYLIITEAMVMETTIQAYFHGTVKDIYVLN